MLAFASEKLSLRLEIRRFGEASIAECRIKFEGPASAMHVSLVGFESTATKEVYCVINKQAFEATNNEHSQAISSYE